MGGTGSGILGLLKRHISASPSEVCVFLCTVSFATIDQLGLSFRHTVGFSPNSTQWVDIWEGIVYLVHLSSPQTAQE